MAMIDDRDLMVIEPSLFADAMAVATLLIDATDGSISNGRLTSMSSDFESAGIDAGHVVVVEGEVCEVVNRISSATVTISLPRANADDPVIEPSAGSNLVVKVPTFERQMNVAQAWVFGALGIDMEDTEAVLDEAAILNADRVARLLAMETIRRVFGIAAATDPTSVSLAERGEYYRKEVWATRRQTRAVLDLDGDGVADCTRQVSVVTLRRT